MGEKLQYRQAKNIERCKIETRVLLITARNLTST